MRKIITTKNYFLGLLLLFLGIIAVVFFAFAGLTILAVVFAIAIVLYLMFGFSYLMKKIFKRK